MRVLCCLDGTNVEQVSRATQMLATSRPPTLAILYVTDTGPRHDIERLRERFLRPPAPPPPREEEIRQAEKKRLLKLSSMKGSVTFLLRKRYKAGTTRA
jgi:hypothetical protein